MNRTSIRRRSAWAVALAVVACGGSGGSGGSAEPPGGAPGADGGSDPAASGPGDGLTLEQEAILETIPYEEPPPPEEVTMPDGDPLGSSTEAKTGAADGPRSSSSSGPASASPLDAAGTSGPLALKNTLLRAMLKEAKRYAHRPEWHFPAEPPDGPEQTNGIAYRWGGKDPGPRERPTEGACTQRVHGLDCSGLVYLAARAAGLEIATGNALAQGDPGMWTSALRSAFPSETALSMQDVAPVSSYEDGDLLVWSRHIAIAYGKDGAMGALQSVGGKDAEFCAKNLDEGHGPRWLSLFRKRGTFDVQEGPPQHVLRLVVSLGGQWDVHLRCVTKANDVGVTRIQVADDEGGPISSGVAAGQDYDGKALTFQLSGTYDRARDVLTGKLVTNGGDRVDTFEQKLRKDDTGYFGLTPVVQPENACAAQARLVRVKSAK